MNNTQINGSGEGENQKVYCDCERVVVAPLLQDFIPMQIKHMYQMCQDKKGAQRKWFYVMSFTNNKLFYLHKIYS